MKSPVSSSLPRRGFLKTSARMAIGMALASSLPLGAAPRAAAQTAASGTARFKGKIRKSLKWNMVADRALPLADTFRKLRDCGFEGIEAKVTEIADLDEWAAASRTSGLVIDGTLTGRDLADLPRNLEVTRRLGGDSTLVVLPYPRDRPIMESWQKAQEGVRAAIPAAEKHGVKMLVENVWATFTISPFDMARFIDEVDSPWVGVHFDIGNVIRWGIAEHWLQVIGSRAQKLDVKEYDLDKAMNEGMRSGFQTPIGDGSVNWPAVREELAKIGFSGWAAAEVKGGDWNYLADVARRMDRVLGLA